MPKGLTALVHSITTWNFLKIGSTDQQQFLKVDPVLHYRRRKTFKHLYELNKQTPTGKINS